MEENKKFWLSFASLETVSPQFVKLLYDAKGNIAEAWYIDEKELSEIEGVKKSQVNSFLSARKSVEPDKAYDFIAERGYGVITYEDVDYPKLLRNIYNPPMTLFSRGKLSRCNLEKTLAVVGSRKASDSAKTILAQILSEFSGTDVCVVSGLASGIDSVAHKSALENGLKTIAVIGSGFDFVYPSSNRNLYKDIEAFGGAILTEYWPSFEPLPFRFPQRNRIVSGISYGTLVAEAALKSGALVTANLTLEQGRELMCMPGALTNPNTQGIYKLLKDGASLVTAAQDVFDALGWQVERSQPCGKEICGVELFGDEKLVYELVAVEPMSADRILSELNLNISDLMVILTSLEIKGLVKQVDGDRYAGALKV